jgi:hypothetical protein
MLDNYNPIQCSLRRNFMPGTGRSLILAPQEAEIRKIVVQSQTGQIVPETLSQKTHHKKGLVEV